MKLRDDIDLANTWVVSDTHFGHDNIVPFCHRPEDHEQVIIAEWRAHVPEDATVLHLGDLCYKSNAFFKRIVSKELTGDRKLLIQGNHDRQRYSFYRDSGFKIVKPFGIKVWEYSYGAGLVPPAVTGGTHTVSFSHYPWSEVDEGEPMPSNHVRVHGHIHNNGYTREEFVPFLKNHINVSAEQTHYRPVNLKLLLDGYLYNRVPGGVETTIPNERL